jgi:hypothetical protein
MSRHRKQPAADSERADSMVAAVLQGAFQRGNVFPTDFSDPIQAVGLRKAEQSSGGGGAEFDGLFRELATQTQSARGTQAVHNIRHRFLAKTLIRPI